MLPVFMVSSLYLMLRQSKRPNKRQKPKSASFCFSGFKFLNQCCSFFMLMTLNNRVPVGDSFPAFDQKAMRVIVRTSDIAEVALGDQ
jgi:hypothetical protein